MADATTFLNQIMQGEFDADLDKILEAYKQRVKIARQIAAQNNLFTIRVGDRVELKDLRPAYLDGLKGTVEQVNGARFNVKVDFMPPQGWAKFRSTDNKPVVHGIPASCLTKIAA